ncbi:HAD family hydrolase [Cryobacterium sp. TMT4-31]|uniref:HAD family hydrolase n=1 Tax=Cryobacterium sp. TMT4-31 TaxID=1259259 RepID=UPI00106BA0EF|nr:HAD-IA family hydrolase [Cryobacterium sp. TMT4-31]TFC86360.1 HAD family hydrolase [Cryobacterium sp. TMT4-31]
MAQLIWDMDGTLLDSTHVVPAAFVTVAHQLGARDIDRDQVVAAYSLGVPEVMLPHLVGRPVTNQEMSLYYECLRGQQIEPYAGIIETLAEVRRLGQQVVVFTGASSRAARILFDAAGIDVDLLIGGDHVQHPKPAPDGVVRAAQAAGASLSNVIYIGDAPTDLQAAQSAGAVGAAAAWGHLYDPKAPATVTLRRPEDALPLIGHNTVAAPHPHVSR